MKHFLFLLAFLLPSLSYGLTLTQTADVVEITPVTTGHYLWYYIHPNLSLNQFSVQMNGTGIQQALFDGLVWDKLIIGDTYSFIEFDGFPTCTTYSDCLSDPEFVASYPSFLMTDGAVVEPTPAGTTLAISSIGGSFISAFFDYVVALMTNAMFVTVMIALVFLFFGKAMVLRYVLWKDRRENPYS